MGDQAGKGGRAESVDESEADEVLVRRFLAGDASAFGKLVDTHYEPLARLVYRLMGWSGDVEDIVQEVFVAAWRGLKNYRGTGTVAGWLQVIAINKCRSYGRRRRWLRLFRSRQGEVAVPSGGLSAPLQAEQHERAERVRRAVRGLPGRYREVVVLRYLQQMPAEQIGRLLGISPNAVNVRLHRARAMLRGMLADLADDEGEAQ